MKKPKMIKKKYTYGYKTMRIPITAADAQMISDAGMTLGDFQTWYTGVSSQGKGRCRMFVQGLARDADEAKRIRSAIEARGGV